MQLITVTADTVGRWHALWERAFAAELVAMPADPIEEAIAWLEADGILRHELFVGVDETGTDVAAGSAEMPLCDNLDEATVTVCVLPAARRQGHGTELLAAMSARCRELGRIRLMAQVPGALDGVPTPAQRFAARRGFVDKLAEVRRVIDTSDLADLATLEAAAWRHAEGYTLVSWVDRAPAEHVPGLAALAARMSTDAPQGELVRELEMWDTDRWLAMEVATAARNVRRLGTMALRGDEVVAYTDFGISRGLLEVGYQWTTIVRSDHRGHRLGMLVKAVNLRQLRERSPDTRWVNTWNAASNGFMISINEALGWRPVDTWTEAQLDL